MLQDSTIAERRVAARVAVERSVAVVTAAGTIEARTVNVSTSGMLLSLDGALPIWAEVTLDLCGGARGARVVRHDGERYGLVFREPLSADEFTAFTGVMLADGEGEAPAPVRGKPVGRTAPWAFGRDRLKMLKREAAKRADLEQRR